MRSAYISRPHSNKNVRFSLQRAGAAAEIQPDDRPLPYGGRGGDGVAQIPADTSAQVQSDAAGLPVRPPVAAGVAPVEDAGQILRRDADAGVADDERFGRFQIMLMPPSRVYLSAFDKTCSTTNRSHFSSVTHDTSSGV